MAYRNRTVEEIASLFDGLEWVEPGLVPVSLWRPDATDVGEPRPVDAFGGVARKA